MKKIATIVWKDIITELRTKELLSTMIAFSILVVVVFNFSLNLSKQLVLMVIPSILWITFIFVGILGLSRSFALEKENNAVVGILLTPTDRSIIFIAKCLSNFIFLSLIQIILLALVVLFFNLDISGTMLNLAIILFFGTIGFVSVGTLFSTMAINTNLREVILPILLFPILIPLIINAVKATSVIIMGGTFGDIVQYLKILIAFDLIFLTLCAVIYEFVIEESY